VKTKIGLLLGILVLMTGVSLMAGQSLPEVKAKIDFSFSVEGKVLPPGQYDFKRNIQAEVFRVQGEGKNAALAKIITRVSGEIHTTLQDAHLVFDIVNGEYMLSEIWVPGEDGYVLLTTKGKHEHKVINVQQ
jgi:hypothetical protein